MVPTASILVKLEFHKKIDGLVQNYCNAFTKVKELQ